MSAPVITGAAITASASVVVAVLAFVLGQRAQLRLERRQARLGRVNSQLRELYGPLCALANVNENIWEALHGPVVPDRDDRRSSGVVAEQQLQEWRSWLENALMPANIQMRDLIIRHSDLIIEREMPDPLQNFCSHVAAYEVFIASGHDSAPFGRRALIEHPGARYVDYVRRSFAALKLEQAGLLKAG